jgi:hypothetical protein
LVFLTGSVNYCYVSVCYGVSKKTLLFRNKPKETEIFVRPHNSRCTMGSYKRKHSGAAQSPGRQTRKAPVDCGQTRPGVAPKNTYRCNRPASRRHTGRPRKRDKLLRETEGEWGRSQIIRRRESLALCNTLNTLSTHNYSKGGFIKDEYCS